MARSGRPISAKDASQKLRQGRSPPPDRRPLVPPPLVLAGRLRTLRGRQGERAGLASPNLMKILQLISSGGFYGAESVLLNLSVELQRSGHTCIVGVFENSRNANTEVGARAEIAGLAVRRIPCRSRLDWQTVREIQKIIEEDGIDLVHAHGYKADFYALLAARLAEVPVTATCHNWLGESRSMRSYARLDRYLLRFFDGVAAVS